jgi:hypothetical protein
MGLMFSIGAVILWLAFSLLNQNAIGKLPANASGIWTGLMMAGAGIGTLCLLPVVQVLNSLKLPALGFNVSLAGHLYVWGLVIAVTSSIRRSLGVEHSISSSAHSAFWATDSP